LLRLIRFQVRLGFTVEERTAMQAANARQAGAEKSIPLSQLGEELRRIGVEDSPGEIVRLLHEAGLLTLFSPALAGQNLNLPGLAKLDAAIRTVPDDTRWRAARLAPFLHILAGKFSVKEKQALIKVAEFSKAEVDAWQKLEARGKKVETALRSPRIRKPSHVYHVVSGAAPEEVLFLLCHSTHKPVQERLKNYFQKYVPAVREITPEEWASIEGKPGTPKHRKALETFVSRRLDRRIPKPPEPEVPAAEEPPPAENVARRGR
jgi:tRNA nucleotidyltransferase/poly(A) polymerase